MVIWEKTDFWQQKKSEKLIFDEISPSDSSYKKNIFVYHRLRGHFDIWTAKKKLLSPCLFVLSKCDFLKNKKILWSQRFSGYLRKNCFLDKKKSEKLIFDKKKWNQPFRLKLQKNYFITICSSQQCSIFWKKQFLLL